MGERASVPDLPAPNQILNLLPIGQQGIRLDNLERCEGEARDWPAMRSSQTGSTLTQPLSFAWVSLPSSNVTLHSAQPASHPCFCSGVR